MRDRPQADAGDAGGGAPSTPLPVVQSVSPNRAERLPAASEGVESAGLAVSVFGRNFVARSRVLVDGKDVESNPLENWIDDLLAS